MRCACHERGHGGMCGLALHSRACDSALPGPCGRCYSGMPMSELLLPSFSWGLLGPFLGPVREAEVV
jgi:hypothetical protein